MKKLLGLTLSLAFVCVMGVSISGCKDPKATTPPATDAKKGLAASTPDAVKIKVGEKKDVKIEYKVGADVKVKTIAVAHDDKVKASVSPEKDMAKSGDAMVTIEGLTEGSSTVTVTATGDGTTPATTTTKINVTVEKK